MSHRDPWFDEDPAPRQPAGMPPRRSRSRRLAIVAVVVAGLLVGLTTFSQFWTERLWYDSVGYGSVFGRLVWTRIGLFLVFAAVMALGVAGSLVLAYRIRPFLRAPSPEQQSLERYREAVMPMRWLLLVGTTLVLAGFGGASASTQWRTYLLWRNAESFGYTDPYFGKDAGFYVFTLPWLHYVVDYLIAVGLIALLASVLVHYVFGGIRLQGRGDRITPGAAAQLSALLGFLVLAKAADYALDRYDSLTASGSLVDGATYADLNAGIPARNILIWISVICAVLFFVNIWRRTWRLPSVGLILMAISALVLGVIWPGLVQRFEVNPSMLAKERDYIQDNVDATRYSYGLQDAEQQSYQGSVSVESEQLKKEALQVGIRLVDPRLVSDTFEQKQQVKGYYSVPNVLDVDRYQIDGQERDVVLAVRELNQDGIPEGAQNWQNLHTVYTHGYGLIAAYGNQRGTDNSEQITSVTDGVAWAEEDLPPTGQLTDLAGEDGYRGQIYFGENSPSYSIVGREPGSEEDKELDLPEGPDGGETKTTYDGQAGVEIGSLAKKLMFAMKYGEPNLVLSGEVHDNSKILYHRDPAEMVNKVAPWLTVDNDPFPAMVDGRVVWMLDGYTTSNQFPQAEKDSFESMTTDALTEDSAFQTAPTDEINYMRNAVKAVVDAYDGTVTLYAWDEEDPILRAWTKAFPNTVLPKSEIPEELLAHMRYPEDMFKVQRYQLAAYHVKDADDFFSKNDLWQVPSDPNDSTNNRLQPPYRLSVAMPDKNGDQGSPTFSLTSVYKPSGEDRQNLAAFVSVNSDAADPDYGKFSVLRLSGETQVPGPGQISNNIQGDDAVKRELLSFTNDAGSRVEYGNLLTLPVGKGLMYVQPIYTQRTSGVGNYPQLQFVVVSFGAKVGFGRTLEDAIASILGEDAPSSGGSDSSSGSGSGGNPLSAGAAEELRKAMAAFKRAGEAQKAGDTATWAEELEVAEGHVERAAELEAQAESAASEESASPRGSTSGKKP